MAKNKTDAKPEKQEEPEGPRVATGVSFPSRSPTREPNDIGVTTVRRQDAGGSRARTMHGFAAAEACTLFGRPGKGGGEAFVRWLGIQHPEVTLDVRLSADEWEPLLKEFSERPIHGHRRTEEGGNHRVNKIHLR
jgi:hypothetical protein